MRPPVLVFFKQLEVARGYCAAAASREVTQNLPCHLFLHGAAEGVGVGVAVAVAVGERYSGYRFVTEIRFF